MTLRLVSGIVILLFSLQLLGQQEQCLAHIKYKQAAINNPDLVNQRLERKQLLQNYIHKQKAKKNNAVVILPIVFHVIYNTTAQNIDSSQIASQIDVLNADFRKVNDNLNILQGGFSDLAADIEIEFKLATIDPTGSATNGITRTFTSNPAIGGSDTDYYDPAKGGVPAWDPERYINVWVLNINSSGGDFGFATFPGDADPVSSDGAVIDFKYFGTTGTAANSQPQHLGRTLTHEFGHYFGLFHIWGDVDDCSADDDINDTPLQETSTDGCLTYPHYDLCTTTGDGINFQNYMDYTDDPCMAMFTEDQKNKMRAVLAMPYAQGGRAELLNLFSSTPILPVFELDAFPNPFSDQIFISIDDVQMFGNTLNIFDSNGRIIKSEIISHQNQTINLQSISNGIYYLEIRSREGVWRKKIVHIN